MRTERAFQATATLHQQCEQPYCLYQKDAQGCKAPALSSDSHRPGKPSRVRTPGHLLTSYHRNELLIKETFVVHCRSLGRPIYDCHVCEKLPASLLQQASFAKKGETIESLH